MQKKGRYWKFRKLKSAKAWFKWNSKRMLRLANRVNKMKDKILPKEPTFLIFWRLQICEWRRSHVSVLHIINFMKGWYAKRYSCWILKFVMEKSPRVIKSIPIRAWKSGVNFSRGHQDFINSELSFKINVNDILGVKRVQVH